MQALTAETSITLTVLKFPYEKTAGQTSRPEGNHPRPHSANQEDHFT